MSIQATISDSKEIFVKEFPYVIPPLYRKIIDELLVELHLLSHQKAFVVDPFFSTGLTEIFKVFTQGYVPETHKEEVFKALCAANGIQENEIIVQAKDQLEKVKSISIEQFKKDIKNIYNKEGVKSFYSRITAIGLYTILGYISDIQNQNEDQRKETLKDVVTYYGYDNNRVEKDVNLFKNNIEKMKQALEIIAQNKK